MAILSNNGTTFEYRGVKNLVYAPVQYDNDERYWATPVIRLAPVATISRETTNNSKTSYYDDQPMVVIQSTGSDTINLTVAPPDLKTLANITGQDFEGDIGAMIEGERFDKDFALGYEYEGTDGRRRISWRYKGKFSFPNETYNTKDDGTDTGNVTITYTGVSTTYKFEKTGQGAKGVIVDDSYGLLDYDHFLDTVKTPDDITPTGGSSRVPEPEFIPSSGVFSDSISVTMATRSSGVSIKYTTDGTNPKTSDTARTYSSPVTISATTTFMAYAYAGGSPAEPSDIVTKTYTKK